jgi:hypothetical protein
MVNDLLVIFGAGASFDSFSSIPPTHPAVGWDVEWRPPLAQQLFQNRPHFREAISDYPKCRILVPKLEPAANTTVEQVLGRLLEESAGDEERFRQLASIRFYLRRIIWECGRHWLDLAKGVSNYKTLVDSIRHYSTGDVCFVTFNYDTMLEDALQTVGQSFRRIPDYVHCRYKVIKLHGSVNWVRPVNTEDFDNVVARQTDLEVAHEMIEKGTELEFTGELEIADGPISKKGDRALFPAIAIPTEAKKKFECPDEHVEYLKSFLRNVSRIAVIGWRAAEKEFLQLLCQQLETAPQVVVAGSNMAGSKKIKDKLVSAGIKGIGKDHENIILADGGFSGFVRVGADDFLRT